MRLLFKLGLVNGNCFPVFITVWKQELKSWHESPKNHIWRSCKSGAYTLSELFLNCVTMQKLPLRFAGLAGSINKCYFAEVGVYTRWSLLTKTKRSASCFLVHINFSKIDQRQTALPLLPQSSNMHSNLEVKYYMINLSKRVRRLM